MNERIRELAKQQAGAILMDLVMPDSGMPERVKWNVGITTEHLEKFAELIVAECIGIVEPTNHHEAFAQGYMGGVDGLDLLYGKVKQIKKHFGAEE